MLDLYKREFSGTVLLLYADEIKRMKEQGFLWPLLLCLRHDYNIVLWQFKIDFCRCSYVVVIVLQLFPSALGSILPIEPPASVKSDVCHIVRINTFILLVLSYASYEHEHIQMSLFSRRIARHRTQSRSYNYFFNVFTNCKCQDSSRYVQYYNFQGLDRTERIISSS